MSHKGDKNFRNRMNFLADREGNASALARRCGLSVTTVRNYLKGGEPTRPVLLQIADRMNVSPEWLLSGKGTPEILSDATSKSCVPVPFVPSQSLSRLWPSSGRLATDLVCPATEILTLDLEWAKLHLGVQAAPALILQMEDRSMEPTIQLGDYLFIDTTDTSLRNGYFALIVKGTTIIKRVIWDTLEEIKLVADNERYGTMTLSVSESAETHRLIGRVAFRLGKLAG